MSGQPTSEDMRNVTSSPGSAGGVSPCVSPDGLTIGKSGPDRVHANLSARQAKAMGLLMSGTYGQHGTISSGSAALQRSLESRLRAKTASSGSTLYKLTWRERITPSGRAIFALRASARRISGKGSDSSPTICDLPQVGWLTPSANEDAAGNPGAKMQAMLGSQAKMAGWPTPMAGTPAQNGNNPAGSTDSSRKTVALAGWPTANATDSTGAGTQGRQGGMNLQTAAHLPGPCRLTTSGEMLTGCSARMDAGGQLNPEHSRWLMGYPAEWGFCGAMAMQSIRGNSRRSSKRISKEK